MQGPSKDDRLIIRPFDMNSYIYNIIHFFLIYKVESSPSEAIPWYGAPKILGKLTGEYLTQKCDSSKTTAMQLYWNQTLTWMFSRKFAAYPPKHSTWRGCFRCIYNTLIEYVRNLRFMWHKPVAVFKHTLVYWSK